MITITASEKKAICGKYPNAYVVRTMRGDSKRHHYFMVESGAPYRMLMELRGEKSPKKPMRRSANYMPDYNRQRSFA